MNPERYGKVVVLMGGWSSEREISLASGQCAVQGLRVAGVDAFGLDLRLPAVRALMAERFDRAFVAMHGAGGEDGVVQGVLEAMRVPYTGSGCAASALCMDKFATKCVWFSVGLPTPEFMELAAGFEPAAVLANCGLPVFVKPACEGSSIGVSRVASLADVRGAWEAAGGRRVRVFAERAIDGGEYTVGFVGARLLPPIKIETPREFYDYEAKYESSETRYLCPCGLSSGEIERLGELVNRALRAVRASGWGRVDLMRAGPDDFYLIEVNTTPGLTSHSLAPLAARAMGLDFPDLMLAALDSSMEREREWLA